MASPVRLCAVVLWGAAICILGQSNLPPVFIQDMDNLALSEETPIGTLIYTLQGEDPENSTIKYGLVGTDKFSVNPDTGDVTLVQPLDRELVDNIKLLVSIEDEVAGGPNNLVQVPITVIVLDENDNPPVFRNSPYEVNVAEDEVVGKTILSNILVEDQDSVGDNLEVTCVPNEQWPDACDIFDVVSIHSSAHQYNGALVLKKPLDYNEKQFYQFQLNATDGSLSSKTDVEVRIADVQNLPPVFIGTLTASVSEASSVGSAVLTVKARDRDRAAPRDIRYSLITNPLDFFLLDSVTGDLKTAKPLDREALSDPSSPLNLTVRASELVNGQPLVSNITSSTATITITIKDVNDEPPRFNSKEYRIDIPESLPPGTPLPNLDMTVTDTDVGTNSVFTLRVSNEVGAFIVEPSQATGSTPVTLRLNSTLDYEDPNQRKFILEVIAEELHTSPRLSSKASVTISVLDVNDNAPIFSSPVQSATVPEVASPGTRVTTLTATDRDTHRFGTEGIVYQLFGAGSELFTADNRTGVISVNDCLTPGLAPCLDFENKKDYFLHYKATDDDGFGQSTVVSLQISVTDANDNAPEFASPLYKANIDEDATKFDPEIQVQAKDADVTSEIRYFLIETESPFYMDPVTGKLGVKPRPNLTYEGDHHIVLTVLATDGVYNASCVVDVTVRDVNNHPPQFSRPTYNGTVMEDAPTGTVVVGVSASDADVGPNAEVRYSIQKGALDAFTVDPQSGILSVLSGLDYEKRNSYTVTVLATDSGMPSLTGTAEVMIDVINVNDKKPYFTPQVQRAEVSADAEIGTVVHQLTATDPDVTDKELLVYSLDRNTPIKAVLDNGQEVTEDIFTDWFTVSPNGSVWVASQLLRHRAAILTLPVLVDDSSAPNLQQAQGELTIRIVDVNRHAPVFPQSHYYERLVEEQPTGTTLGTYTASDTETPISLLLISPPNDYFAIDNQTGVVKSIQRIDYEQVRRIEFTLVAFDSGVPQLSGNATVTVDVINVNDEVPLFDQPEDYVADVVENAKEGTPVLNVHAEDKDEGKFGEIRYSLSGQHASQFHIDPVSGEVTVARDVTLDRELTPQLLLFVVATDMTHNVTHPIHITVLDENDNPPIFSQKVYKSTIAENLRVDPPPAILQVLADDKDIGVNGLIKYQIIDQSEPDTFRVDESSGIIYPKKAVTGGVTYRLTITATDEFGEGRHWDTAKVDIYVLSVNKHKPEFVVPGPEQRVIEIPEAAAQPNYLVMTVKATDKDSGENGRITYYLKDGNRNVRETSHFVMDPDSGELRVKTLLDREDTPQYQLVVVASDLGTPAQYESLHFLTVVLLDDDDNVPHFHKQHYHFSVLENQPTNSIIGVLKATDKDSGDNGKIYYHILEGNQEHAFTLDRTQGFLRSNISFDRETQSEYRLTILASNEPVVERPSDVINSVTVDNGTEGRGQSVARLTVTVLDENDNRPEFGQHVYYAVIKNTAKMNEPIISMVAADGDLDENGTLVYVIGASNLYKFGDHKSSGSIVPSPFNITQDGMVVTASPMSEYSQDRFVLEVLATEKAPPYRRATAQLYIWVSEVGGWLRAVSSRSCRASPLAVVLEKAADVRLVAAHHHNHNYNHLCEIYLLPVDPKSHQVLDPEKVLETIDAKYDQLKDLYHTYGIETVMAGTLTTRAPEGFDPALAALIALLIVLFTGIVTFIVVCSCLKHWVISPPSLESSKGDSLSRRRILEELSTTENPLWLETKLRPYEEQELSMHVFGDHQDHQDHPDPDLARTDPGQPDNTYATIQTNRDPPDEYATLSPLEAALGFQGSTFKPPDADTPEPPPRPTGLAQLSW